MFEVKLDSEILFQNTDFDRSGLHAEIGMLYVGVVNHFITPALKRHTTRFEQK